uniref:F-box domain-containing protein n=1 Tax=Zea mays TaxID=4577 RepID=A0A804NHM7_MAIZE
MIPARCCLRFLPPPPFTHAAQPDAAAVCFPPPETSEDRISQLPPDVQRTIVSKLPVKDGVATAVLSSRWRWIWSSIPLVLDDAQLRPAGAYELDDDEDEDEDTEAAEYLSRAVVGDKVSDILRSHPGPFRSVRLTSSPASSLRDWLLTMAEKGVEELVVLNCEWPTALMVLSVELLRCESLKRLHLALCQMPRLAVPGWPGQRRAVRFPNLQQLVLCHAFVPISDIGGFLAGCPALEFKPVKLTVDAPRLERVILWRTNQFFIPPRTRVIIRRAPNLRMIGYLEPKLHVLESGDTVIKEGTRPNPDAMLPSVEILAVKIRFGVREDERTLMSYLRVFPNIRTLHIQSAPGPLHLEDEDAGGAFWIDGIFSSIKCISKIKKFSFYDFYDMGNDSELLFIKSIAQACSSLEHMLIAISASIMEPPSWLKSRLMDAMSEVEWASEASMLDIVTGNHKEWEYGTASDQSLSDPFEYI